MIFTDSFSEISSDVSWALNWRYFTILRFFSLGFSGVSIGNLMKKRVTISPISKWNRKEMSPPDQANSLCELMRENNERIY